MISTTRFSWSGMSQTLPNRLSSLGALKLTEDNPCEVKTSLEFVRFFASVWLQDMRVESG